MMAVSSPSVASPFGILKTIRYMVNSSPEFLEVIHTVNGIVGTVSRLEDVEMLQKSANFSIMTLPHSQTKFIACFDIPSDLLGQTSAKKALLPNFSEYSDRDSVPQVIKKPPQVLFTFNVKTLFDVNLALYQFEAILAPTIPQSQWLRVRRSIVVALSAGECPDVPLRMVIAAEANPALPIAPPTN